MKRTALIFGVALISVTIWTPASPMNKIPPPDIKIYPDFGRECPNGNSDCLFTPKEAASGAGTIYFSCKPGTAETSKRFCFCGHGEPPQDQLMWPLEWDRALEKCFVAPGGPCGKGGGLGVSCHQDMECISGRCRKQSEINSVDLNRFCNDDLDCKKGLVCQDSVTPTMVKVKRCYQNNKN